MNQEQQILRLIVEEESAGLYYNHRHNSYYCWHCEADALERDEFKHDPDCPIRQGRELLRIKK